MTEQELRELIRSQLADINEGKKLKLDIEVPMRDPEIKKFIHNYLLLNKKYSIFKAPEYSMTFGENKWKKETHWKHDSDNNIIYVNDASVVDLLLKGGAPSDLFESNTINESVVNEAEKYITDEFKVGDKIKTGFGEWEVIETDYAPNKSFMGSFIFKGKDMKRVNIPNPPRTNKNAVGYKVTDGDKYPIIGFLYQYKDITKLATVGVDESVVAEMKNPRKVFDYSKLTFSQIERLEDLYAKFTKGDKPEIANESVVNEYMDINDPVLVAIRAWKTEIKNAKAAPKKKKISTSQYYKLMDKEIDLIDQMRDATKEFEQLDSDMNQEAGQKGDSWSDDDANRYGGELDRLQTKIEKLAKQKAKVKDDIMNYRIN